MGFEEGFGVWRMVLGVYEWADDRKYEGEWQNNKMYDRRYFELPDGRKYKGESKKIKSSMDFPIQTCRIRNRDYCMAQMNYSLACLRLSLLCFVGLMIPYFITGFIPFFANHEEVGDLRGSPASSWPTFLGRG